MRTFVKFTEVIGGLVFKPIWFDPEDIELISGHYDDKNNTYMGIVTLKSGMTVMLQEKPEVIANKCGIKLPLEAL